MLEKFTTEFHGVKKVYIPIPPCPSAYSVVVFKRHQGLAC
jgi:hypothetical protein